MSSSTLRILGHVALALSAFAVADGAEAGMIGSDFASFGRLSPVQTVQFGGGNCYYADGWNGRGWYQCGNEWSDGFGWIGPFNLNTFGGRRHRHGVVVSHPRALNPVYPRLEPPRRLGASGVPAFHTFGSAPGLHRFGASGVPTSPSFRVGAATVSGGFAGGGFHGGLGGGNFHQFHGAGVPHIGAPVSPDFAGGGGLSGLGRATGVHIGAPASPGFVGVGDFHGFGDAGGVHIGAPASPGFAGGGFHGVGGAGAFHGGGAAFGQGGIGHR
jgi:hypothetical protein